MSINVRFINSPSNIAVDETLQFREALVRFDEIFAELTKLNAISGVSANRHSQNGGSR